LFVYRARLDRYFRKITIWGSPCPGDRSKLFELSERIRTHAAPGYCRRDQALRQQSVAGGKTARISKALYVLARAKCSLKLPPLPVIDAMTPHRRHSLCVTAALVVALMPPQLAAQQAPAPSGAMVDLGGHRLHVQCSGRGRPTVVVENGLGDYSFDWVLVQRKVALFTRICTYDRAGYAWSDPGPQPRTFAQLNLELHDALAKLNEKGPFVLVGHSFGGPVVRNYAALYPREVSGMVQVDAAFEGQRIGIGGNRTLKLGTDAHDLPIPAPHEQMHDDDYPKSPPPAKPAATLDPIYATLPNLAKQRQRWADSLPARRIAEASQTKWSTEYFAKWMAASQDGVLGEIPLVVLTRANGGYDRDLDVTAAEMEKERLAGQAMLTRLSRRSKQVFLNCGHNMDLEDPKGVTDAIRNVVQQVRGGSAG
jgi:pimeloyl-ACP methyl ester carboxylesterase